MFESPRLDTLDNRTVRNYFMNADLRYFQRSISELISNGSFDYVADRFLVGPGLDGVAGSQTTYSRSTDVPDSEAKYSLQTVANYSDNEEHSFIQRIESIFAKDFTGQKVSFRFWYKTDGCDQIRVKLQHATAEDNFTSTSIVYNQTFAITGDSTWRSITVEGIDIANVENGLQFHAVYISNTTASVTSFFALPQLNLGETIEDFTIFGRDTIEEFKYCQRYCQKSYSVDTPLGTVTVLGQHIARGPSNDQTASTTYGVTFQHRLRTDNPVLTTFSPSTGNSNVVNMEGFGDRGLSSVEANDRFATVFTLPQTPQGSELAISYHWVADAEL